MSHNVISPEESNPFLSLVYWEKSKAVPALYLTCSLLGNLSDLQRKEMLLNKSCVSLMLLFWSTTL